MKLGQGQKLILGFFTLLPFLLIPYYLYEFFQFFTEIIQTSVHHEEPDPLVMMQFMMPMFAAIGILSLTSLALLVFYIVHVVNNSVITGNERIVWILLFVFAGMIAFPVYFFMRVWKDVPVVQ
jgi:hypothetical protein